MNKKQNKADMIAEAKVSSAMEEISCATRKVLMDYMLDMYYISFSKIIAYLGVKSNESQELLANLDEKMKQKVINAAIGLRKNDRKVIEEVEHILTASGMDFTQDYKTIKKYLLHTTHEFAEKTIKDFREDTPIFQKKLNKCIFNFDDILMLDDRAIQKILQKVDQRTLAKALKGTDTEIQAKFFRNMSHRTASMLKEDMEWMGPVRSTDVENCQSEIVKIIFRLEDKGEIVISKIRISDIFVD